MDADTKQISNVTEKRKFKDLSDTKKQELLDGKDKANTQRSTKQAMKQFVDYLALKQLPSLEELEISQLDDILSDFYCQVKPIKEEDYAVQTLKCMRSSLNRWFRKEKGIDIVTDPRFVKANEMMKAVQVNSKKKGKGVCKSYPPITPIDLERIAEYFSHDHVTLPSPRKLQQNIIFYILYFFCRRGRENLHSMKTTTFRYICEPDGTEYFIQETDEMDKNHGIYDQNKTNEGRIYATGGKSLQNLIIFLFF